MNAEVNEEELSKIKRLEEWYKPVVINGIELDRVTNVLLKMFIDSEIASWTGANEEKSKQYVGEFLHNEFVGALERVKTALYHLLSDEKGNES